MIPLPSSSMSFPSSVWDQAKPANRIPQTNLQSKIMHIYVMSESGALRSDRTLCGYHKVAIRRPP